MLDKLDLQMPVFVSQCFRWLTFLVAAIPIFYFFDSEQHPIHTRLPRTTRGHCGTYHFQRPASIYAAPKPRLSDQPCDQLCSLTAFISQCGIYQKPANTITELGDSNFLSLTFRSCFSHAHSHTIDGCSRSHIQQVASRPVIFVGDLKEVVDGAKNKE